MSGTMKGKQEYRKAWYQFRMTRGDVAYIQAMHKQLQEFILQHNHCDCSLCKSGDFCLIENTAHGIELILNGISGELKK